jgi:hypothetical protein
MDPGDGLGKIWHEAGAEAPKYGDLGAALNVMFFMLKK